MGSLLVSTTQQKYEFDNEKDKVWREGEENVQEQELKIISE
jgi:hypothetical protein